MARGKKRQSGSAAAATRSDAAVREEAPPRVDEAPGRDSSSGSSRSRAPISGFSFFPSDLTWLYRECEHCFYLKAKHGVKRPGGMMPNIFRVIDTQIRGFCMEKKRTEEVCPQMPPGEFISGEQWVRSVAYSMPGHSEKFTLRGKPDTIVKWDVSEQVPDGGYGVIDFKTTQVKESSGGFYATQLEIYSNAVEQPHDPSGLMSPVTQNGLLAWQPEVFGEGEAIGENAGLDLKGKLIWVPVPRDRDALRTFLGGVMNVLSAEEPPAPNPNCSFCKYRAEMARTETKLEEERLASEEAKAAHLELDEAAVAAAAAA